MAGAVLKTFRSILASAGVRSARKRRSPLTTAAGSWSGTRRKESLAPALEAITVLLPAPM